MFYYPHHIGDYKAATTYLSNEEDLAYRRLLELYYDTEKAIEDDIPLLSKRLRVTPEALSFVLKEFFSHTKEGWKNKRCDVVIKDYQEMAEKNRKNGKAGGRPKANKQAAENPVGFQSVPSGIPEATHSKANQEPITKNQEPKKQPTVDLPVWLPKEKWEAFVQMRKQLKKPMSEYAIKLMVDKLVRLRDAGHNVGELLDKSITNSWLDVYEPKGGSVQGVVQLTAAERLKRMAG
jgi:uncharacterized protein YdaU (DUF1376 family)